LLRDSSPIPEVELIPCPINLDHDDRHRRVASRSHTPRAPCASGRICAACGCILSLMAGTEWIPAVAGPRMSPSAMRAAHTTSPPPSGPSAAILAMLKYFPFYLDLQRAGQWKRRFEARERYACISGDARPIYPPVLLEELTGKSVLMVGYGAIGKEIERMLAPFHVELTRVARTARDNPLVHAVAELDRLLPQAEIVILILPSTAESHHLIGRRQLALMRQGALLVNAARGPDCRHQTL
jgi:hypothetical protein